METIPSLLRKAVISYPERRFIRWIDPSRPKSNPVEFTYQQFEFLVRQAVQLLLEYGISAGDRVLLIAENSPQWQAIAIAAQSLRAEPVALFSHLGEKDLVDIARRVRPKVIYLSKNVSPKVEGIILKDLELSLPPVSDSSFQDLVQKIGPDDPFMMIFTSGTSGHHKGVRLPQRAFVESLEGGASSLGIDEEDEQLLALPFAHVAGQCAFHVTIKTKGGMILCSRREDLLKAFSLSPTFTLLVPFFYEKIWKEATNRSQLLRWVSSVPFGSILIRRKLRQRLGGRLRILVAGGAPSDPQMVRFFRRLGFEYLDFYGMTETAGTIALNRVGDKNLKPGSVGRPWRSVEALIDEDGEILVRGKTLMSGYLEKEGEETAFTRDGYFRTGDLGRLDPDGYLYVTGRKKNILVLSTGKKVFPEPIEVKLCQSLPIGGALLIGDGKPFVSAALFIPGGVTRSSPDFFLEEIRKILSGFSDYEIPKKVFLIEGTPLDFPEILTPSQKIRRDLFLKKFSSQIDDLHSTADKI